MSNIIHVYPEDEYWHNVSRWEKERKCVCGAKEKIVKGGVIVVHNSADGRELQEWKKEALQ